METAADAPSAPRPSGSPPPTLWPQVHRSRSVAPAELVFLYDCASSVTRMLEITPDDIALLSDTDLRTLIGLLCEAELRKRGLSVVAVTWSGHQNSADGGLDVRVALGDDVTIAGFVPRPHTGFQVKKSPMRRTEILDEMRPEDALRPIIRDLANRSGAYIIVSAESTSETTLRNRYDAMREAVGDLPNAKDLTLDFYDRGRVASWVRDQAGMALWVRSKIGRALPGWRPYEAWAYAPDGVGGEYLLDDAVRVRTDTEATEPGMSAVLGIQRVRDRLRHPGGVVRLVGLSGVGKTRFVQALFDSRVGESSLDPALAIYTDVADGPEPSPATLIQNLIASRSRAIVVVDNCPPDLHRRICDMCRVPESTVSVITVEYDIREDQPEGTEVFELDVSSEGLIEKLLQHRFSYLSWIDLHTIAQFSGGNARIAISLAETVHRDETIAGMSDENLFKRLFEQRNAPSESLLVAAQGLSLVYSFHGEDVSGADGAELFRLGAVVKRNAQEMFQSAVELGRRRLVQRRGVWRAVLPQAIANRLAARALQDIPAALIEKHLVNEAPERLLKSFSRRLGYLDGSQEAKEIARGWLGVGGLLADVLNLNELGESIFRNIAPLDPDATLSALEHALLGSTSEESATKCAHYVQLLTSLAYEPEHFERSVAMLAKAAVAGAEGSPSSIRQNANDTAKAFGSLFLIIQSGTHASPEQRESVIRSLLSSSDPIERELGLRALDAALTAWHFGPVLSFGFGSRSRDFGYWPSTRKEVVEWFSRFLKLAEESACSSYSEAQRVRTIIADKFRGLWTGAQMYVDLERICSSIAKKVFWAEGWSAVRETTYYDSKGFTPDVTAHLARIEAMLQPQGTIQRVRSIVLGNSGSVVGIPLVSDCDEGVESGWSRLQDSAYELGMSVAADSGALTELLPELVRTRSDQIWNFGRGLAQGAENPSNVWRQLVAQLQPVPVEGATTGVFCGFLNGLHQRDPALASSMLDDAINNDALAQCYPALETAIGTIEESGLRRLIRSLELGKAPTHVYRTLQGGGVTHRLSGLEFNELLLRISDRDDGVDIAIEILIMRLSFGRESSTPDELVEIGCELFRRLRVTGSTDSNLAYRLQIVGRNCLLGDKGAATVRVVCANLRVAISRSEASAYGHRELLQMLFSVHPLPVLQSLCGGDDAAMVKTGVRVLEDTDLIRAHAFDVIPEEELLRWCEEKPDFRYPIVAAGIAAIRLDTDGPHWTEIAYRILEKAPDRVQVLKKFIRQLSLPWDPSRAAEVQANLHLLDDFACHPDPKLANFAKSEKSRLSQAIAEARKVRPPIYMERDEGSFE